MTHKGFTLWFTGLSGAGKSTVSEILVDRLQAGDAKVELLDGALLARAGRWWWENDAGKECGIHYSPDGVPRREFDVLLADVLRPAS